MAFQTFSGHNYLKIDIANNYGLDKLNWNDRLSWFDHHYGSFGLNGLHNMITMAEEPALFYAGLKAWEDVERGRPIGYMVSLDATSSGLQLLAALTGDRLAAQLCNVIDTGRREDAYTNIYNAMLVQVQDTSKISRNDTKDAIMTAFYGSTAIPREVFGSGELLNVFFQTMTAKAPAAWELNQAFLAIWDPTCTRYSWILPDNFHVHIDVMRQVRETVHFLNQPFEVFYKVNAPIEGGRSLGANTIHSIDGMIIREMTRRCDYDPEVVATLRTIINDGKPGGRSQAGDADQLVMTLWRHFQRTGFLSARILDYLGPNNIGHVKAEVITELLDSLPDKPFKIITIHDCFRCLPHYGNDLRRQYNLQLELIAKSNLLSDLLSQITGRRIPIQKQDPGLWKDIRNTNYALS